MKYHSEACLLAPLHWLVYHYPSILIESITLTALAIRSNLASPVICDTRKLYHFFDPLVKRDSFNPFTGISWLRLMSVSGTSEAKSTK